MKRILFSCLIMFSFYSFTFSQSVGIKTNLVHWATTTPNFGLEIAFNRKYTMEIIGGVNPFEFKDNKKIQHWILQPEIRYWTCESFNGHFFGLHLLAGAYNAGGVDIPLGRLENLKDYRYEGWGAGGGLSYGYQWMLSPKWNLELNLGAGFIHFNYDKFPCVKCGELLEENATSNYLGVTKAAVSLIFMIK